MILDGISKPSLAASSALAFRDICSECHTLLVPALSNIVTSCQEALSNPQVPFEHSSILVAAVCSVLSSLSLSSLSEPLEFLLNSIIQNLQSLASQQPSLSIYPMIKKELTILNAFSSHLVPKLAAGEQHPVCISIATCIAAIYVIFLSGVINIAKSVAFIEDFTLELDW
jgi:hypothetical protein